MTQCSPLWCSGCRSTLSWASSDEGATDWRTRSTMQVCTGDAAAGLPRQAAAAPRLRSTCPLAEAPPPADGIADSKGKFDEVVEDHGVKVLIDPAALMHVLGTTMDFVEDRIRQAPSCAPRLQAAKEVRRSAAATVDAPRIRWSLCLGSRGVSALIGRSSRAVLQVGVCVCQPERRRHVWLRRVVYNGQREQRRRRCCKTGELMANARPALLFGL